MAVQDTLVLFLVLTWSSAFAFPADVRNSRIVSGWEAEQGQFPHQLSLRTVSPSGAVFACGGSLIHNEWGLTAAHCAAGQVTLVIRAGGVSLSQPEVIFETTEYYLHPQYIEALPNLVQTYDISIIKFNRYVEYSDFIKPIRLQSSAEKDTNYARVRLQTSGWGRTWTNGPSTEVLNWVYMSGISNLECWLAYGGSPIIVRTTVCATYYNVTSQSICQGDNGGALIASDDNGDLYQVGIASFVSDAGCHVGFPAGFVRVGYFHDWFTEVTGVNFDSDDVTTTTESPTTEAEPEEDAATEESESRESRESSESGDDTRESSESNENDSHDDHSSEDEDNSNGDSNGDEDNGNGDDNGDEDNGDGDDNGDDDNGDGDDNGDEDNGNGDDNGDEDNGNGDGNGDDDNGNGDGNGDEGDGNGEDNGEADEARKQH